MLGSSISAWERHRSCCLAGWRAVNTAPLTRGRAAVVIRLESISDVQLAFVINVFVQHIHTVVIGVRSRFEFELLSRRDEVVAPE